MKPSQGHITLDRKITGWEWYQDANVARVFIHLLIIANHKPGSWQGITVRRGQTITGRKELAAALSLSEMNVRTALNKLKLTKEITIKSTSKNSIITICNYDSYQDKKNKSNQRSTIELTNELTNDQPTTNQQLTTNNNDKNDNNDKKITFNNKPLVSDFNGLPENKKIAAYELVFCTQRIKLSDEAIFGLWEVFKEQNLTGDNWYANEGKVYSHFIDKLKFIKFTDNERSKQSIGERQEAGFDALLERGKRVFAQARKTTS